MELRRPTVTQLLSLLFVFGSLAYEFRTRGDTVGLPESLFLTAMLVVLVSGVLVSAFLDSLYYTTLGGGLIVAYSGYLFVSDGGFTAIGGIVVGLLFVGYGFVNPFADSRETA
jgi:hypothetical protein